MARAQEGDTVRVEYVGMLSDGTIFDSSHGRAPLEFTLGEGAVIAGFEEAVLGMEEGYRKTASIPAAKAYGQVNPELQFAVPRERFPDDVEMEEGMRFAIQRPDGQSLPVTVLSLDEETVTLDANHQLAGRDLTFEISLLQVVPPDA